MSTNTIYHFQKYMQGNQHKLNSPSIQVSPRITSIIMYTSPHNSHSHIVTTFTNAHNHQAHKQV